MVCDQSGRRALATRPSPSRVAHITSAITSRYAALRREQITAARRIAARDGEREARPRATCRIAAARDRRTPFVWRSPRRAW